jgi:3-oxoacyl-[acyl-carrier protein] reductase
MDLGLRGRAALVCGSSQGLGTGVKVAAIPADLTDPRSIKGVVDTAVSELGKVDILVTNTGGPPSGPFEDHSAEIWSKAIAQNFESVVNLVREALPAMKERRWGRIINVTSISVKQPVAGLILSNSIRAGVTGFAKTIANEAAPFGVTVNNLLPGFTRTERLGELAEAVGGRTGQTPESVYAEWEGEVPMGRLGNPAELGALAAFLASEQAAYITGQSVAVDGGWIKGLM